MQLLFRQLSAEGKIKGHLPEIHTHTQTNMCLCYGHSVSYGTLSGQKCGNMGNGVYMFESI